MERNSALDVAFRCKFCLEIYFNAKEFVYHKLTKHASEMLPIMTAAKAAEATPTEESDADVISGAADQSATSHEGIVKLEVEETKLSDGPGPIQAAVPTDNPLSSGFQCRFCQKSFSKRSRVVRHELIHTGEKPFACNRCSHRFNQKSTCTSHMKICRGHPQKRLRSSIVGFKEVKKLIAAIKFEDSAHFKKPTFPKLETEPTTSLHSSPTNLGEDYSDESEQIAGASEKIEADELMRDSRRSKVKALEQLVTKKRQKLDDLAVVCRFCGKSFRGRYDLRRHETRHTGEKQFKCEKCSMGFGERYRLNRHWSTCGESSAERISLCGPTIENENALESSLSQPGPTDPDNIGFPDAASQTEILEALHSEAEPEKVMDHISYPTKFDPLECKYCGRRFRNRLYALRHEKTHVNEGLPYEIDQNSSSSNDRASPIESYIASAMELNTGSKFVFEHVGALVKTEVMEEDETQLASAVTESLYSASNETRTESMTAYEAGPSNYSSFKSGRGPRDMIYNPHISKGFRDGKVIYSCKFCSKTGIRDRTDAARHTRVHVGPNIYFCPHCPQRFSHRPLLINHIDTHAGEYNAQDLEA